MPHPRAGVTDQAAEFSYWIIQNRARAGSQLFRSDWYDNGVEGGQLIGTETENPEAIVPQWAPQLSPRFKESNDAYHEVIARMNGWPLCSLGGLLVFEQTGIQRTNRFISISAVRLGDGSFSPPPDEWNDNPRPYHWDQRLLPLRPIWPGFAINTLFYTAILWGLFAAPFALRRRRRIKRGLCPKCAYPVGTSDKCTECGAAVVSRPARGGGV